MAAKSAAADSVSSAAVVGELSGLAVTVESIAAIAAVELGVVLTSAVVLKPVVVDSDVPALAMTHASAEAAGSPDSEKHYQASNQAVVSSGDLMNHPAPELSAETWHWRPLASAPGHGAGSAAQWRSHPSLRNKIYCWMKRTWVKQAVACRTQCWCWCSAVAEALPRVPNWHL